MDVIDIAIPKVNGKKNKISDIKHILLQKYGVFISPNNPSGKLPCG